MSKLGRLFAVAALLAAACGKDRLAGADCSSDATCAAGYVCFGGKCTTPKGRDEQLTKQSGVATPTEKPAVGGDRVRIRTTSGEGTIFAQCAANERLTGGGCKGGDDCRSDSKCRYLRSYPGGTGTDDTLGGRWYCSGPYGTVSAYALCQEARPADASTSGSGGSGSGSGLRTP